MLKRKFVKKTKKMKVLKLASWWKRFLSYSIDSILLFAILIFFVAGIYGEDLITLFDNISQVGGLKLIQESNLFEDQINSLSLLSSNEQNIIYWTYIIQSKYARSIFIISQIVSSLYFFVFWWGTGQTLGGMLFKIKVITPLGEKPSIISIISRVAALKLIEIAWGLPALIVVNPMLKQRVQDSLSNTVVVEEFKDEETEEEEEEEEEESSISNITSEKENED